MFVTFIRRLRRLNYNLSSCQNSKGVSEPNSTASVNRRITLPHKCGGPKPARTPHLCGRVPKMRIAERSWGYLTLSSTISPSSKGKYKIEQRNNCRARGTVKCREN